MAYYRHIPQHCLNFREAMGYLTMSALLRITAINHGNSTSSTSDFPSHVWSTECNHALSRRSVGGVWLQTPWQAESAGVGRWAVHADAVSTKTVLGPVTKSVPYLPISPTNPRGLDRKRWRFRMISNIFGDVFVHPPKRCRSKCTCVNVYIYI